MASFELFNLNKSKVLKLVAKRAYEGKLSSLTPDEIALELYPDLKAEYHCCVYKEREIIRERVNMAMGKKPNGQELDSNQLIYVLEAACDGCDIHKVRITDNCRKCLFHPCEQACRFEAIYAGDSKMHINYDKCRTCGLCAKACAYGAILLSERPCKRSCPTGALKHIRSEIAQITEAECLNCGQCAAHCPFGAINEVSFIVPAIQSIKANEEVIAIVAPAIQGQFPNASIDQILEGIERLGFKKALEVSIGADLITINEAKEALNAKKNGHPLTTSCCPAFLGLMKKKFPDVYEKYTSHTVSPMTATAAFAKHLYPNAKVVFIGPCMAKKEEMKFQKNKDLVDLVLTFEELDAFLNAASIELASIEVDGVREHGSIYGRSFPVSGGVANSVNQCLVEMNEEPLKVFAVSGPQNCNDALKALSKGQFDYDLLEGMMCEGGCLAGVSSLTSNYNAAKNAAKKENIPLVDSKIGDVKTIIDPSLIKLDFDKKDD